MNNPRVFSYEMGYTQPEFEQVLNGGFTDASSPYRCTSENVGHWLIEHRSQPFKVIVELSPKDERKLGAFSLPVLGVRFNVVQSSEEQSNAFFDRFFKYFHKGGG